MLLSASFSAVLTALLSASGANAWFRVACTSPLVQERIDPIVNPGANPSQHVHTVHGGDAFGPSTTFDDLRGSSCTSCEVSPQDFSNYWFPKLYFQDPVTKELEDVQNGGLLVYYENRGDLDPSNGGPGLTAFPPGFRMISGNPAKRSKEYPVGEGSQGELAERAIQWACLRYGSNTGYDNTDGSGFPHTNCESGFNARIHLPACWDGVNLDSDDHTSHVAFLSGLDNGACPDTHPVGFIAMFYEITWDVNAFTDRWDDSTDAWPFVYATGDPTGYSWHGDFLNGWDQTALQNAIDYCNNPNDATGSGDTAACQYLTVIPASTADSCKTAQVVTEVITGNMTALPGCNPVFAGPGDATLTTVPAGQHC